MQSLDTFIALNRFGLGPAPDEAARLGSDPRGWITSQIRPTRPVPRAFDVFGDSATILGDIHTARLSGAEALKKATRKAYRQSFGREIVVRARVMIGTRAPFHERMVAFWSNHFTVSNAKSIIGPAIPAYEREAIRPHVFGRFADMLKTVVRHPVMISYLDNNLSMGETSPAGRRRSQRTGSSKTLNENLAREILELHTLGVHGGYVQADVIELARALTGWNHGGTRSRKDPRPVHGYFEFRANFHEPGARTLLGRTYPDGGEDQALAMLDDLARHPSTARFIATKLLRHFVSDTPPAAAVDRIAEVFLETDGDLAEVARALVPLAEVWADPLPKAKSHYELIVSTHRATGNTNAKGRDIIQPLRELGQLPFTAPSPAGWGDRARDWVAPEALMRRIEWVRRYAGTLPATLFPDPFLDQTIGPVASDDTRLWTSRAPSGDAALAMILASPEFQRR